MNHQKKHATLPYQTEVPSNAQNQNPKTPDYKNAKIAKSTALQCWTLIAIDIAVERANCSFKTPPARVKHLYPTISVQKE